MTAESARENANKRRRTLGSGGVVSHFGPRAGS